LRKKVSLRSSSRKRQHGLDAFARDQHRTELRCRDIVAVRESGAAEGAIAGVGSSPEAGLQVLSNTVEQEATTLSLIHMFWTTSTILLVAAALIWLAPRSKRQGGVSLGH
jgi:hypothetical protein